MAHDFFVILRQRTFAGNGIDAGKILDENAGGCGQVGAEWNQRKTHRARRLLSAHQAPVRSAYAAILEIQDTDSAMESPPVPKSERARVSLTMIVKDEEDNLPHCLESVSGVFDEIVIVDTGSTDRAGRDRPLLWGEGSPFPLD